MKRCITNCIPSVIIWCGWSWTTHFVFISTVNPSNPAITHYNIGLGPVVLNIKKFQWSFMPCHSDSKLRINQWHSQITRIQQVPKIKQGHHRSIASRHSNALQMEGSEAWTDGFLARIGSQGDPEKPRKLSFAGHVWNPLSFVCGSGLLPFVTAVEVCLLLLKILVLLFSHLCFLFVCLFVCLCVCLFVQFVSFCSFFLLPHALFQWILTSMDL